MRRRHPLKGRTVILIVVSLLGGCSVAVHMMVSDAIDEFRGPPVAERRIQVGMKARSPNQKLEAFLYSRETSGLGSNRHGVAIVHTADRIASFPTYGDVKRWAAIEGHFHFTEIRWTSNRKLVVSVSWSGSHELPEPRTHDGVSLLFRRSR